LGARFLCFPYRAPSFLPQSRRRERGIPHMDDGGCVGIEAPPAGLSVEGGDDSVIRRKDGPGNVVALEGVLDSFTIAAPKLVLKVHHAIAVELHVGVDERTHVLKDEKAAEGIVVEHSPPSQFQRDCAQGRDRRADAVGSARLAS
jgi:hypothetical protein